MNQEERFSVKLSNLNSEELNLALCDRGITYINPETNRKYTRNQIANEIKSRLGETLSKVQHEFVGLRNSNYRAIIDHWKYFPIIPSLEEFSKSCKKLPFKAPPPPEPPDIERERRILIRKTTEDIYRKFPFNMMPVSASKKKAIEEMEAIWPQRLTEIEGSYRKALETFQAKVNELRTNHDDAEARRVGPLLRILENDSEATYELACQVFEEIDWPFSTFAGIATNDGVNLYVNLDLPEIEDVIPERLPKIGRGGKITEQKRSKSDQNKDYFHLVVGQAAYLAACQFATNPTLVSVSIAAFTQRARSPVEHPEDEYVYCITLTNEQIKGFNPRRDSLSSLIDQAGAAISIDRYGALRRIDPPAWVV